MCVMPSPARFPDAMQSTSHAVLLDRIGDLPQDSSVNQLLRDTLCYSTSLDMRLDQSRRFVVAREHAWPLLVLAVVLALALRSDSV